MEFTYKDGSTPIKVTISKIEANSFSVSLIDRTHEGIPWRLLHNHMMENRLDYQKMLKPTGRRIVVEVTKTYAQ